MVVCNRFSWKVGCGGRLLPDFVCCGRGFARRGRATTSNHQSSVPVVSKHGWRRGSSRCSCRCCCCGGGGRRDLYCPVHGLEFFPGQHDSLGYVVTLQHSLLRGYRDMSVWLLVILHVVLLHRLRNEKPGPGRRRQRTPCGTGR